MMSHDFATPEPQPAKLRSSWQGRLHQKMQQQSTTRWVNEHVPMVMPPKPLFIAVRRVLGIAVYAFIKYPMPHGKDEVTYERIA